MLGGVAQGHKAYVDPPRAQSGMSEVSGADQCLLGTSHLATTRDRTLGVASAAEAEHWWSGESSVSRFNTDLNALPNYSSSLWACVYEPHPAQRKSVYVKLCRERDSIETVSSRRLGSDRSTPESTSQYIGRAVQVMGSSV